MAATSSSARDTPPTEDVAQTAGRGGLAIAFAKVWFILLGLVQQIALPRVLGLSGYGALSSVLSAASITYNPIVTTSIQGVSRAIAQSRDADQPAALRRVLWVHGAMAIALAAGFFLLAPSVAAFMKAPHLVPALRIMSGVLLLYGVYAPLVGALNGRKRFLHQAGLDIVFAVVRTAGLVAGGWWFARSLGQGVEGASVGFVGAAAFILALALAFVGLGKAGAGGPTVREHLAFVAPLLVGQTLLNLLLQADLTLLRRFAGESAMAAGRSFADADPLVGAYRATQLFCFLPYQLLIAVTFILFPLLATAHRDGDAEAVTRYVKTGVRLALVLMGVMVSVTSGLSGPLMRLIFPAEAADLGGEAMQVLTLGFGAFAIFGIFTTVLNSLKRERTSAVLTGIAFGLVVALCFAFVAGRSFDRGLLLATALSTSAGLVVATVTTGVAVHRAAGGVVAWQTVVRVGVAMTAAIAVGRHLPAGGKVTTIVWAIAVAVVYVAILLVSRELVRTDLDAVRAVIRRKRAQP